MRRGNKSNKVPNVKLRPAPAQPRAREPDAPCSSDSEMPPNPSMADLCPRPFKGLTICATGTMDKTTLFKMAFELGATSTSDFTDRVTHLIANSHGGAKYICALERKIPIMTPDWMTEAHAIWLRGDDVDVEQSLSKHRLPIFSGVILSLSGIEDVHRRTEINRILTAHQGTYLKNLERPVKVTHLLCSGDTETEKMKYAEKFNKRKEAHIHLVWEEWFWDCLEFGGRFDERKYQVSRPRPERKSLLETPIPSFPVQDSAPGTHPNAAISVDGVVPPKRLKPVVPTGNFTVISNLQIEGEEEEVAIVNKPVPAVTLQLWQSLLKPRGFEIENGKLVRSPSKSQTERSSPSTPTRPRARLDDWNRNGKRVEKEKDSVISSFRRAHSFAPVPVKEPAVRQPFRRNTTCPMVCPGEAEGSGLYDPVHPEGESAVQTLFAGYTFRLLGEARCTNVRLAIENGGGIIVDDDAEEPCFIIVRLISGSKLYHDEFDDHARTRYRTECWLEHSVFHERICEPDENVSFTPLKITTPVPDSEKIHLSLSGLDQSELCWIRRLVRAVGIILEPTFSRRSTHLICPSGTGAKFDKALEWQIPVVSLAWLEHFAQTGTVPRVEEYLVGGSRAGATSDPLPEVRRDKGKGKEKEVDYQMMDITNDTTNQPMPMFVKNAALLQDTVPWNWEFNPRLSHNKTPPRNGLFGKPRFLTHDSDPPEDAEAHGGRPPMSSPPPAPPLSSSPPPVEAELPLFELTPPQPTLSLNDTHAIAQANPNAQPPKANPPTTSQAQARIPSSTSPSPMKILPSSSLPNAFVPSSPGLPDTEAITIALHESLTTLLGKRPLVTEDEGNQASGNACVGAGAARAGACNARAGAGAGAGGAKRGKRVRPGGPSTAPSRNPSHDNVLLPILHPHPRALADLDTSLLDGLDGFDPGPADESLRVTYEDPGQAAEKRRLLRMLGGDEALKEMERVRVGPRRSKRTKVS